MSKALNFISPMQALENQQSQDKSYTHPSFTPQNKIIFLCKLNLREDSLGDFAYTLFQHVQPQIQFFIGNC
jgi:hypothetical protein